MGLLDSGLAEQFVVINYSSLGEVPPRPSFLVQGPDLLLLFGPALPWKSLPGKKLFLNQYSQKVTMFCTSQSPHSHPCGGGQEIWGGGHTRRVEVAGKGWDGAAWEGKSRDFCACQPCIPVLGKCQSPAAQPSSSPAISTVSLRAVTSHAEEMTSRAGQQEPGAR